MKLLLSDTIEADSSAYERAKITKRQVKKFKSPDLNKCYQINIPDLRLTYYCRSVKRMNAKLKELKKQYPETEIICKEK
jgi:hypothetical protein